MVGASDVITGKLSQELMARGYVIERIKGHLVVRIDQSVGAVLIVRRQGQKCQLYYGLETMQRGASKVIILSLFAPPIALALTIYYLSKVIRFGRESLDVIAMNASQRPETQEKSVKEMLTEGVSEARRMCIEAYEAAKSNYEDVLVLTLILGLVSFTITIALLFRLSNVNGFVVDGGTALFVGATAFVVPVILSFVFVRRRYLPKLDRLRAWRATLSDAFESEGYPTSGEIASDSHFELLVRASKEIPEWLEIRRKSMLAREPSWSVAMMYTIYMGATIATLGAVGVVHGTIGGLALSFAGAIMIAIGVKIYTATARRMASEMKVLDDSWRRRSEQMTTEMEDLFGGEA